jgi:hypothetical protein
VPLALAFQPMFVFAALGLSALMMLARLILGWAMSD